MRQAVSLNQNIPMCDKPSRPSPLSMIRFAHRLCTCCHNPVHTPRLIDRNGICNPEPLLSARSRRYPYPCWRVHMPQGLLQTAVCRRISPSRRFPPFQKAPHRIFSPGFRLPLPRRSVSAKEASEYLPPKCFFRRRPCSICSEALRHTCVRHCPRGMKARFR